MNVTNRELEVGLSSVDAIMNLIEQKNKLCIIRVETGKGGSITMPIKNTGKAWALTKAFFQKIINFCGFKTIKYYIHLPGREFEDKLKTQLVLQLKNNFGQIADSFKDLPNTPPKMAFTACKWGDGTATDVELDYRYNTPAVSDNQRAVQTLSERVGKLAFIVSGKEIEELQTKLLAIDAS